MVEAAKKAESFLASETLLVEKLEEFCEIWKLELTSSQKNEDEPEVWTAHLRDRPGFHNASVYVMVEGKPFQRVIRFSEAGELSLELSRVRSSRSKPRVKRVPVSRAAGNCEAGTESPRKVRVRRVPVSPSK